MMLHRCQQCLGVDVLRHIYGTTLIMHCTDPENTVQYKQWTHNGQSKLQSVTQTVADFTDTLYEAAENTAVHHFTSKSQSTLV